MTDKELENILLQPVLMYMDNIEKERLRSEKFIFNYLIKKGGKGEIYSLLLKVNGINLSLEYFLKSIEFYTKKTPLIKILKQSKNKAILELTLSGNAFYNSVEKKEIIIPSLFFRINHFIINLFRKIWYFIFIKLEKVFKRFFNSGWWLLLAAIIAFIYFILQYNQTNKSQKQSIETIKK